jgi:hypothetical protein
MTHDTKPACVELIAVCKVHGMTVPALSSKLRSATIVALTVSIVEWVSWSLRSVGPLPFWPASSRLPKPLAPGSRPATIERPARSLSPPPSTRSPPSGLAVPYPVVGGEADEAFAPNAMIGERRAASAITRACSARRWAGVGCPFAFPLALAGMPLGGTVFPDASTA